MGKSDIGGRMDVNGSASFRSSGGGRSGFHCCSACVRNAKGIDSQDAVKISALYRTNAHGRGQLCDTRFTSFTGKRCIGQLERPATEGDGSRKILVNRNGIVDTGLKGAKPGEAIGGLHAGGI